ncbi:MAG TPA: ABATE domain-containing protein [Acetobacteraceae bacterium]|nr:ABATE domain-containing protein [Acetobacteraceae bacterium]
MSPTARASFPAVPGQAPADDLCLEFANTRSWRGRATPTEALTGLPDLLHWLGAAGQGASPFLAVVAEWPRRHPKRAARLFDDALALRETIFRCAFSLAEGHAIAEADFAALNKALGDAPCRHRLVRSGEGFTWAADDQGPAAAGLLAPVLWSAADMLVRAGHLPVRRCANDECLWLFIDRSKTGSRRWCDMTSCGNRAKAQRHYRRAHAAC